MLARAPRFPSSRIHSSGGPDGSERVTRSSLWLPSSVQLFSQLAFSLQASWLLLLFSEPPSWLQASWQQASWPRASWPRASFLFRCWLLGFRQLGFQFGNPGIRLGELSFDLVFSLQQLQSVSSPTERPVSPSPARWQGRLLDRL